MRTFLSADGPDQLPQAMVELATAYDWADLPDRLKDTLRHAADELREWAAVKDEILAGEIVPETFAVSMATKSIEAVQHETWRNK